MARHYSNGALRPVQQPKSGFGFLAAVLDGIDAAPLVSVLESYHRETGRPGYPPRAMLRAYLAKFVLNIRYGNALLEQLRSSPRLREVCGFGDDIPSESALSRFVARLRKHRAMLERCITETVDQLRAELPGLGRVVAVDATAVDSFSNPNRSVPTDPDARWGVKHSARAKGKDGEDWFFGYKVHMAADATYGLPLGYTVTPGNESDYPHLPKVVRKFRAEHPWLKAHYLLADRGYDGQSNHRFLAARRITPVIHIRKPTADDGLHDGVYDAEGRPTCLGQVPMTYVRTDPETGHHLYRCPADGCALKGRGLVPNCRQEVWENPADNLRVIGILPRHTALWKRLYRMRWSVERTFGSLKASRGLEGHRVRGIGGIELLAALSVLSYLATALARLRAGDSDNLRRMAVRVA